MYLQLDINTVAAGGGSRLFFRSGMFVVGPESAGANPGPVCYGKGLGERERDSRSTKALTGASFVFVTSHFIAVLQLKNFGSRKFILLSLLSYYQFRSC